jgi:hypothetical protein
VDTPLDRRRRRRSRRRGMKTGLVAAAAGTVTYLVKRSGSGPQSYQAPTNV